MPATFLKFGDPPPTAGGDFERDATRYLRDALPSAFVLCGNVSFPTYSSYFYEYDLIVMGPAVCEILEFKACRAQITVYEDRLEGMRGFSVDRVFSTLENKSRVLASRLTTPPFSLSARPFVITRIVVPDGTRIKYKHNAHRANSKVISLREAARHFKDLALSGDKSLAKQSAGKLRQVWETYQTSWTASAIKTTHSLGRFKLRRVLANAESSREYLAMDEPPCKVDVHLKEFPFDPLMSPDELEAYLADVSQEMRTLRRIRHPHIACVIGHFQTESSLVQVSDWFDGQSLQDLWSVVRQLSFADKIGLMVKVSEALAFCHQRGVFHRNLCAANILVDKDVADLRVCGFEFSKDLYRTRTVATQRLQKRDPRIIAPEEVLESADPNPRRADVFQVGVLFYRILENGDFPFENPLEYYTGEGRLRPMSSHGEHPQVELVRALISEMLSLAPGQRPDPMSRVNQRLIDVIRRK